MELTTHDRPIETPRPRYILLLKNWIFGAFFTLSPLQVMRQFRWYMLFAESMGYIRAQLATPQKPPAMATDKGFVGDMSPR